MVCVTDFIPFRVIVRAIGLVLLVVILTTSHARAGVIQSVFTDFTPGSSGTPAAESDTASVFELDSGDITTNILAGIGGLGAGSPGYFANSSAGIFGDVGLNAGTLGVGPGSRVESQVVIGSQEFVNVLGVPVHLTTNFIVDGGFIQDFSSTSTTVTFSLEVGATNLGPVGPETDPAFAEAEAFNTAFFGGFGGFFFDFEGGRYTATYTIDATGNRSFSDMVEGGLDLGATFDPDPTSSSVVDIPFSFQSLDLVTLQPGDRLGLGYVATITIEQNGVSEGIFAGFSDPLQLSGNGIRNSLVVTPLDQTVAVPGPAALPVFAAGLILVFVARRRG